MNINLSPEGLEKLGNDVKAQSKIIDDALTRLKQRAGGLDSWKSDNKALFDAELDRRMPGMREVVTVLESYGNVAVRTANRLREVEARIKNSISMN